jgi:hypothetical protein
MSRLSLKIFSKEDIQRAPIERRLARFRSYIEGNLIPNPNYNSGLPHVEDRLALSAASLVFLSTFV